jgi:PiT family inorganic phosphate transporter
MPFDVGTLTLFLALLFGLYMAWGIGANDVANAMATSVGSKAVTVKQAILIAAVFEFLGAYLAGGEVTETIRKGIIDAEVLDGNVDVLIAGMLSALLASAVWLTIASQNGWPVSTTHSIVGAIIGFAVAAVGMEAVHWSEVGSIAASWIVSPALAGSIAFALFFSVQRLIFDSDQPERQARRYVPWYIALSVLVVALVTFLKGLAHVGLDLPGEMAVLYSVGVAAVAAGLGWIAVNRVRPAEPQEQRDFHFMSVERVFSVLMVVTACAMAFAHGSNDVANAVGPVAAIVNAVNTGTVTQDAPVGSWILLIGAIGILIGLATFGFRVIATVGNNITELTPSRGFAATLAAAVTVVLASGTGLPISTTHTLVGAVLGVGLARGIGALNLAVIRSILMSWMITLPAGAVLAVLFYFPLYWLLY